MFKHLYKVSQVTFQTFPSVFQDTPNRFAMFPGTFSNMSNVPLDNCSTFLQCFRYDFQLISDQYSNVNFSNASRSFGPTASMICRLFFNTSPIFPDHCFNIPNVLPYQLGNIFAIKFPPVTVTVANTQPNQFGLPLSFDHFGIIEG